MYKLYCDASLQTRKTIIAVVVLKDGVQVFKVRKLLTDCSDSLAAEAFAVKLAMCMAKEIILEFGGSAFVYSDCQSVVDHINGLARKPRTVLFSLPKLTSKRLQVRWIPRGLNNHADALAY
jgi:ribonuclease HI